MKRRLYTGLAACLCLLLAACGRLEGTYSCGQEGADIFEFTGKDTLVLHCRELPIGCTYRIEKDVLYVTSEWFGTIPYAFQKDGQSLIIDGVRYEAQGG